MNTKTRYLLPAFAAVFALAFAATTPYIMAESDSETSHDGEKYHKEHMAFQVEGFVGGIPITEESTHESLKDAITVNLLGVASLYPDAKKASLGIVSNENGDRFVVWKAIEMTLDGETKSLTIHVIDAADSANTATITKEFDPSMKYRGHGKFDAAAFAERLSDPEQLETMIQKFESKINESGDVSDESNLLVQILFKMRMLQSAYSSGDDSQAEQLVTEIVDLKKQYVEMKRQ